MVSRFAEVAFTPLVCVLWTLVRGPLLLPDILRRQRPVMAAERVATAVWLSTQDITCMQLYDRCTFIEYRLVYACGTALQLAAKCFKLYKPFTVRYI